MVNEELIKHKIQVDEHISMDIMIPKTMNALQFKGLTMKANKLFNLSEASVDILPTVKRKVSSNRLTREHQLFILKKFFIEKVEKKTIPILFKEKYPEFSDKGNKTILYVAYNNKCKKTPLYNEIIKELENGK